MIILDLTSGQSTILSADALNSYQEEVAAFIESAGISLSENLENQLHQAIVNVVSEISIDGRQNGTI